MTTDPTSHWQERLATANAAHDPHILADIILAAEDIFLPRNLIDDPNPLPHGQPSRAIVKAAGRQILHWLDEFLSEDAWAWEALAQQAAYRYSPQDPGDVDAKLTEQTTHLEHALQLLTGKDPILELFILGKLSASYKNVFANRESLGTAWRMLGILDQSDPIRSSKVESLVSHGGDLPVAALLARFRVRAHHRASTAARSLRDYQAAVEHCDKWVEAAELLVDRQPNLLCLALGERAALAWRTGDIHTNGVYLERQRRLAEQRPWWVTDSQVLRSKSKEAQSLSDFDTAQQCRSQSLALRASQAGFTLDPVTPATTAAVVHQLHDTGQQPTLTDIGNDSCELATNLIRSGRGQMDPSARAQARQWLDVAEHAWRDVTMNGRYAIAFCRLEIDILDNQAPPAAEVGRQMVDLSRRWRRADGQLRATLTATIEGAPGDMEVLGRLHELQQDAPPIDRAHLNVGIARWHLRAGDAALDRDDLDGALAHWRDAAAGGASAAEGLTVTHPDRPVVVLNHQRYIEALLTRAEAQRRLRLNESRSPQPSPTKKDELATRLQSLIAIARRMSASATPTQRQITSTIYTQPLSRATELAIDVGDHNAIDAICEVIRRDASGVILAGITKDPNTPARVAQLARQLTAALQASIDPTTDNSTADPTDTMIDDATGFDAGQRAATIEDHLADTLDVIGTVIGPVARAIFDPTDVTSATSERLLSHPDSPHAVLSLWLRPDHQLLRHLAWRTDHGISHAMDTVHTPDWFPQLTANDIEPALFMAALDNLTNVLIPPQLQDLLTSTDPDHPIDLTIIPTGLYGIPFTAVPVTRQHLLIDLATITIVQSLTAAHALLDQARQATPTLHSASLAVYDPQLTHAQAELDDLLKHHRDVRQVTSLEQLATELGADHQAHPRRMLVLALHGLRGKDGWSQTKLLPSGQLLRTTHILEWHIPTLVVGASCDTDIRDDHTGELGGFPLAFQLRGAQTVIGTLTRVDDKATAEIMGLFYAATAAQLSPPQALRHAQRTYFSAHDRKAQRHLWAFHITYGHPRTTQPQPPRPTGLLHQIGDICELEPWDEGPVMGLSTMSS